MCCAPRSVITFAANVPKRDYLPVLLAMLTSSVLPLRQVSAASVHLLSSSHVGAAPLPPQNGLPRALCHLDLAEDTVAELQPCTVGARSLA